LKKKLSKIHSDQLSRIKSNIEESYLFFEKNRQYFNKMRNFVFNTTITDDQRSALQTMEMPLLEFNVIESYISRLCGEFSKQIPGINVFADPTASIPPENTIKFVQNHMRHIITNLRSNEIYKDILSGGFSGLKVWTDYRNPKSFDQNIYCDRVFDPLLCGWDPAAQKSHKGDGAYCFELIPLREEQVRNKFGSEINLKNCFNSGFGSFKWGFNSNRRNFVMICDFYEKKSRKTKLLELPNGMSLTEEEYAEYLSRFDKNFTDIRQPMKPVNSRITDLPYVVRYRLIGDKILEYRETQFTSLPIIFVDGNSIQTRRGGDGSDIEQITRSYAHNAVGSQKLKNLAGQTIANHIETLTKHKMKISVDSIPPQYLEAYTNPQMPNNYLYQQYSEDGTRQYNPPMEVVQTPLPPEIVSIFMNAEQTIQASLGSYDAALGINKNQLSGVAIVEGATQSNAAAMPFVISYLSSLQQAAEIILDQIPKIYITPRSMPIINSEDKNEHVTINDPNDPSSPKINFNSDDLKIEVKAGVNFEVQKNRALQMFIDLSQALPGMAQIINNPKGLSIVADNLSFKGADQIKQLAEEASKKMDAQKSQPQPPPPALLKLNLEAQKIQSKSQNEQTALGIKKQDSDTKRMEMYAKTENARLKTILESQRDQTERLVHGINANLKTSEMTHKMRKEILDSTTDLLDSMQGATQNHSSLPDETDIQNFPQNE